MGGGILDESGTTFWGGRVLKKLLPRKILTYHFNITIGINYTKHLRTYLENLELRSASPGTLDDVTNLERHLPLGRDWFKSNSHNFLGGVGFKKNPCPSGRP